MICLLRGIAWSHTFINYAVWKSAEHFKRAFNSTEFRASSNDLSANIVMALHLFKKTAIPDICVD